jgi:hypothetical protein
MDVVVMRVSDPQWSMEPDEAKVARLPLWAQELIGRQKARIKAMEGEMETLREAVDGFIAIDEADNDTVRLSDQSVLPSGNDAPDMMLGSGAVIRFGDKFEVRWIGDGIEVVSDEALLIWPDSRNKVEVR